MPDPSLAWLFLDLNSYFVSVEQELQPKLRGRPAAVVPVDADTTCCIAVSYEARAYGVRTGLSVARSRELCPHLLLVEGRPKLYVEMHHRILKAIEECLPVDAVLSCDEFLCRLIGSQRQRSHALALAEQVKQSIRHKAGSTLRCSIGLGPSRLLAKIAAEMKRPDGLVAIETNDLPQALHPLRLSDIPGVGERMERRLSAAGISSVKELCALSRQRMAALWGSVLGERLWLELRGEDLPALPTSQRQTISRQHILPPELRSESGCRQVALKLLQDCTRRMRRHRLGAGGLGVAIYYVHHDYAFAADRRVPFCTEGMSLQEHLLPLLAGAPNHKPHSLCVYLSHLEPVAQAELFAPSLQVRRRSAATGAMEQIHQRFGKGAVYLGSLHGARDVAPARISFGPPPVLDEF